MDFNNILNSLGFFLAGLAVNLTPCVYPMLTVTVSLFKAKDSAQQSLGRSFSKALVYFLGIAVMYSTLGYFAATSGKLFGSILQNSWVLGAVAALMFYLAFTMFGVFYLRMPSGLLNRLSGLRKANYVGLFFSGMFVGIFAAPCIGPPVLALLAAVANNGDPKFGFTAFFTFSLGLGSPYLLLGTFSGLVAKLPKSGNWLKWVERIFGIILLGFAFFYLALALHWNLPKGKSSAMWTPYSVEEEQKAIASHKPMVIDFFAEWCIGCHELDQKVFSKPDVQAKLAQFTTLRVDATDIDAPQVQKVVDKYEIIGLPTVLFLDGNGKEIKTARVEGSESAKEFTKSLDLFAKEVGITFKE